MVGINLTAIIATALLVACSLDLGVSINKKDKRGMVMSGFCVILCLVMCVLAQKI